jgi:hypothetical protein
MSNAAAKRILVFMGASGTIPIYPVGRSVNPDGFC